MRNESGIYYGRHTLPQNRLNAPEIDLRAKRASGTDWVPASQPSATSSQPTVSASQPSAASSQPSAASSQPSDASSQPSDASSQPMDSASQPSATASQPTAPSSQATAGTSQPSDATSQPTSSSMASVGSNLVPAPGTAARYAGIEPHPTFQYGGDLRLALYSPLGHGDNRKTAVFPMQTLPAYRPYNPKKDQGRLTILLNTGV